MGTRLRHRQVSDNLYFLGVKYFRYSYAGGKLRRTYAGLIFLNVAYTKYDVTVIHRVDEVCHDFAAD
jgi:hypothetical protein